MWSYTFDSCRPAATTPDPPIQMHAQLVQAFTYFQWVEGSKPLPSTSGGSLSPVRMKEEACCNPTAQSFFHLTSARESRRPPTH